VYVYLGGKGGGDLATADQYQREHMVQQVTDDLCRTGLPLNIPVAAFQIRASARLVCLGEHSLGCIMQMLC
jgi:hypothetical protein